MQTLRLQRDPDGLFLWHPDYAPWLVGRHSLAANPNDRAFFDPNTGEIVWANRDGMKDYQIDQLAGLSYAAFCLDKLQRLDRRRAADDSSAGGARTACRRRRARASS